MDALYDRSKQDFLIYANSVIKSRAIPSIEDNLKPIHRKILYTLWEDKVFNDKPTKKCATECGRALAYSPHGDASVYGALVRLGQWWKVRYPLVEIQGNAGNLLGDSSAAPRYTETRLSKIGMLMLEDLNKNCVEFKPNYDGTTVEPVTLPSKFPYLLCGNNSGIAVGLSSDIVSHNFTEVSAAIKYYMYHKDCTIADLLKFIQGPDFSTGGLITNGEDLLRIYTEGCGSIKMQAHYTVAKKSNHTTIVFHDLPYGVEIDSGVKAPLKKMVIEEGNELFEDITVAKVGPRNFDITVTLTKDANISKALELLFAKTRLADSVKINQTLIVNGEPKLCSLKDMIAYWVDYRSNIIKKITQTDYDKVNHKLTVTIGLQKCLSDIDKLIDLIRNADSRAAAKIAIKEAFELNDEQADAVLDMKLSSLSRLNIKELDDDEKKLTNDLERLALIIKDETERYKIITSDLDEIKKVLGKDERCTEIIYTKEVDESQIVDANKVAIKKEWLVYTDGLHSTAFDEAPSIATNLVDTVSAVSEDSIIGYKADGTVIRATYGENLIGAAAIDKKKKVAVMVTQDGYVKTTNLTDFKFKNAEERCIKLHEGDELIYFGFADENDNLLLLNGEDNTVLKIAIKDISPIGKTGMGVKSGYKKVISATIANDNDLVLMVTSDNKGKLTAAKEFSLSARGNKGQQINEDVVTIKRFDDTRTIIYLVPKIGKVITVQRNKISTKSRTANGASLSTRAISKVV